MRERVSVLLILVVFFFLSLFYVSCIDVSVMWSMAIRRIMQFHVIKANYLNHHHHCCCFALWWICVHTFKMLSVRYASSDSEFKFISNLYSSHFPDALPGFSCRISSHLISTQWNACVFDMKNSHLIDINTHRSRSIPCMNDIISRWVIFASDHTYKFSFNGSWRARVHRTLAIRDLRAQHTERVVKITVCVCAAKALISKQKVYISSNIHSICFQLICCSYAET